jgi:hypothetical protein
VAWIVLMLERFEALAASLGQMELAGQICHVAAAFGMVGPCLPG